MRATRARLTLIFTCILWSTIRTAKSQEMAQMRHPVGGNGILGHLPRVGANGRGAEGSVARSESGSIGCAARRRGGAPVNSSSGFGKR